MDAAPLPRVCVCLSMVGHLWLPTMAEHRPALSWAVLGAPMIAFNVTPIPTWLGQRIAGTFSRLGWSERRAWGENERPAPAGSKIGRASCRERVCQYV